MSGVTHLPHNPTHSMCLLISNMQLHTSSNWRFCTKCHWKNKPVCQKNGEGGTKIDLHEQKFAHAKKYSLPQLTSLGYGRNISVHIWSASTWDGRELAPTTQKDDRSYFRVGKISQQKKHILRRKPYTVWGHTLLSGTHKGVVVLIEDFGIGLILVDNIWAWKKTVINPMANLLILQKDWQNIRRATFVICTIFPEIHITSLQNSWHDRFFAGTEIFIMEYVLDNSLQQGPAMTKSALCWIFWRRKDIFVLPSSLFAETSRPL